MKLIKEAIEAETPGIEPGYYKAVTITGYRIRVYVPHKPTKEDGRTSISKFAQTKDIGIRGTVNNCELLVTQEKSYLILNR
jgi:hypothetical protein